ncbi:acyl carrier protein [Kribbella sp. NBC_00359]|uniref:acyl carrier protein n=1 Tax=Kribbella sp. NBC_00359 TaxID=2975966 RepID=UPI002E215A1E
MNEVDEEILKFISTILLEGEDIELDRDTPLLEYRILDSLNAEELIVHLHDVYGVLIEDVPPTEWSTISKLAALVQSRIG